MWKSHGFSLGTWYNDKKHGGKTHIELSGFPRAPESFMDLIQSAMPSCPRWRLLERLRPTLTSVMITSQNPTRRGETRLFLLLEKLIRCLWDSRPVFAEQGSLGLPSGLMQAATKKLKTADGTAWEGEVWNPYGSSSLTSPMKSSCGTFPREHQDVALELAPHLLPLQVQSSCRCAALFKKWGSHPRFMVVYWKTGQMMINHSIFTVETAMIPYKHDYTPFLQL